MGTWARVAALAARAALAASARATRIWCISIGNSTVSRGIWDKYREWYFKIHQNITSRRGGEWYLGSFEISRAGIYPKYPEETVLFPVYTTRQRNFALYVTGVIFTCKNFKFGLNTTGLSQSHFRNFSACSISKITRWTTNCVIFKVLTTTWTINY